MRGARAARRSIVPFGPLDAPSELVVAPDTIIAEAGQSGREFCLAAAAIAGRTCVPPRTESVRTTDDGVGAIVDRVIEPERAAP